MPMSEAGGSPESAPGAGMPETQARHPSSHAEQVVVAIMLSLAALTSSWCAYQAARWSGIQARNFNQSEAARTQSIGASAQANHLMSIDVDLFSSWLQAEATHRDTLADFYRSRFRPDFKPAFEAWLAAHPLNDSKVVSTPFLMPQYRLPEAEKAAALTDSADRHFDQAMAANQQSDDYVLVSVLLASVLFLGGIASNFTRRSVRWGMMAVAGVLLLVALLQVAVYPVA